MELLTQRCLNCAAAQAYDMEAIRQQGPAAITNFGAKRLNRALRNDDVPAHASVHDKTKLTRIPLLLMHHNQDTCCIVSFKSGIITGRFIVGSVCVCIPLLLIRNLRQHEVYNGSQHGRAMQVACNSWFVVATVQCRSIRIQGPTRSFCRRQGRCLLAPDVL